MLIRFNALFFTAFLLIVSSILTSCVSYQSCGNEVHIAKNRAPLRLSFSSNKSCGNESHIAKKKKVRKKDMGLYGRKENPYRR